MKITVEFEDNEHIYTVDFLRLAKKLKVTEEQIIQAVQDILSKT